MVDLMVKVRKMRNAQKRYFRDKQYVTLIEARQLEREVDKLLDQIVGLPG